MISRLGGYQSEPKCVDCRAEGITTQRKIKIGKGGKPVPGPRCATHHRAKLKDRRNYSHGNHIQETYGITSEEYWAIYEAQNGCCYICGVFRRKDARKKLSVDHCHRTGMVRGLLCQRCNRDVLGHFQDNVDAFHRGIEYLQNPPAIRVIGIRIVPNHQETA